MLLKYSKRKSARKRISVLKQDAGLHRPATVIDKGTSRKRRFEYEHYRTVVDKLP